MKFTLLFVVLCLSFCFVNSLTQTQWGNVNTRVLGTENVFVEWSFLKVKEYNLTYPKQPSRFPITGIRHLDYEKNPVKVNFLQGGIGYNYAKLHITSQRNNGINSTFIFYTI